MCLQSPIRLCRAREKPVTVISVGGRPIVTRRQTDHSGLHLKTERSTHVPHTRRIHSLAKSTQQLNENYSPATIHLYLQHHYHELVACQCAEVPVQGMIELATARQLKASGTRQISLFLGLAWPKSDRLPLRSLFSMRCWYVALEVEEFVFRWLEIANVVG